MSKHRKGVFLLLLAALGWAATGCVVTGGGQVGLTAGVGREQVPRVPPPAAAEQTKGVESADFIEDR